MNKSMPALLAALVLWGGCTLHQPFPRPPAPVPDAWPADGGAEPPQTLSSSDGTPASRIPWRDFFSDPRLQAVIETALDNNRDLRLAALNVARARAIYGIQRSSRYPALDAVAGFDRHRVPADLSSSEVSSTASRYDVDLGLLAWEIDFFGRIRSLEAHALESYLATAQALRASRILIVATVATASLNLVADRENLTLARTTLEAQQSIYDLIRRRFQGGLGTELDLSRAQTQVDTARVEVARYIQQVAQDRNALNLVVGAADPVDPAQLPDNLLDLSPLDRRFAGIPSDVLLKRPDILQAERLLRASEANIDAARAALFPRISLTTTIGTASSQLSGLFESGSGTWRFAPQLQLPIFDARLHAAVDAARTEREIALANYEKAIQSAFREVADALAVNDTIRQRLAAQQDLVQATEKNYRLAGIRYKKGVDSYLGVLDAQRALYGAQQGLVALRRADLINRVRLYAAMGGGGE